MMLSHWKYYSIQELGQDNRLEKLFLWKIGLALDIISTQSDEMSRYEESPIISDARLYIHCKTTYFIRIYR